MSFDYLDNKGKALFKSLSINAVYMYVQVTRYTRGVTDREDDSAMEIKMHLHLVRLMSKQAHWH